ncbi:flavodoxin family protein [Intestinimonas butyriciproducens]|uniref:flavodoxin family protein n=1 Tax=Intestinimonas butyriciproducens TaxID=1297617 RepID=UPI00195EFFE1|nr:flavodoxin family protein [Intestinimonas butyriciproducens]MBM6919203.1 flavodoxin family protein [Intestinimonas butyriciproducens]
MSKKILIVTGSPRTQGNTDLLAQALLKGVEEAGNTGVIFDAGKKNILPCKDCGGCYKKGVPCAFADDFNEVEQELLSCDAIVLATPLYWYTFSGQMKMFIDKLKAFGAGGKSISGKDSALISCGAVSDPGRFSGLVETYRQMCAGSLQWKDKGVLICTSCGEKGTVSQEFLEKAYQLGKSL